MAAEFEHVKFCTVMHVLQRLENWRSSSENTTGDDLIHCLCVRESFERSLEVAVMSYSGENHQSNRNSRYNCKFWTGLLYLPIMSLQTYAVILQTANFVGKYVKILSN